MITHTTINGRTRTISFSDEADLQRKIAILENPKSIEAVLYNIEIAQANIRNIFISNRNNSPFTKRIL